MTPYRDGSEHLLDVLRWVLLLIRRRILLERQSGRHRPDDPFSGLYISDELVDSLLGSLATRPADDGAGMAELQAVDTEIEAARQQLEERVAATGPEVRLPLERACAAFGLDATARAVLAILLCHEVFPPAHDLLARLGNDLVSPNVTVRIALDLLVRRPEDVVALRGHFSPSHVLRRSGLVQVVPPLAGHPAPTFLDQRLRPSPSLVRFALGEPPEEASPWADVALVREGLPAERLRRPASEQGTVARWLALPGGPATPVLALGGPAGVGKRTLLVALATGRGRPVVVVLPRLPADAPEAALESLLCRAAQEALFHDAVLYLDLQAAPALTDTPCPPLLAFAASYPGHLALGIAKRWARSGSFVRPVHELGLATPTAEERLVLWQDLLDGTPAADSLNLTDLARRYSLTAGSIAAAVKEASDTAATRPPGEQELTHQDATDACRRQLATRLSHLADRVHQTLDWRDVVLPQETLDLLMQIPLHIKHRSKVYDTWGFGEKLTYGRGLSCLFSGEPGTGKTMCAGIIARELNMELFRIDLSRIVSKYIGETEQHLAEVFDEAERAQAIILFDEADSLFGKRTDVKSSVDRYANLEVNYLLQRVESYEGVTILTTNFESALDEAFKRRLSFKISFPFPDQEMRIELWKTMIPARAEVSDDIDFVWLAGYEMAGGHIKNVLLRAAFMAAENGTPITGELLEEAVGKEFSEMGKLPQRES